MPSQHGAMVPIPPLGRRFTRLRSVRLGDASPGGRLRLDALARYLQDVSNDDTRDAGLAGAESWVVRRIVLEVLRSPVFNEELTLTTFCSGIGPRWAERRVAVTGSTGAQVEAATLWVHVDDEGRPKTMSDHFHQLYAEAAMGRTVRARLAHDDPPADGAPSRRSRPWPLRFADFDVLAHMNNAAYWQPIEDELARRRELRAPMRAELEFRAAIEPGMDVELLTEDAADRLWAWLIVGGRVHASATVTTLAP